MKFLNVIKKAEKIKFYIGLLAVGLVFAIIGGIVIAMPKGEKLTAEATVKNITAYTDENNEEQHRVTVDYTDQNGVLHENLEYTSYHTGMKEGDTVKVEYDPAEPEQINPAGLGFLPYAALVIGVLCIVFGVVNSVKAIKTKSEDMNELDRVDRTNIDPLAVEEIKNSTEETKEYYFHFTGKLNQSYVMETPNRVAIYRADCDRIGVLRPYIFSFVDCRSGKTVTSEVTHTMTKRFGGGNDSNVTSYSVVSSSSFKIDGENNWDLLAKKGYSLDMKISGIKVNFDVLHYGIKVASIEAAGTNILKDDAKNPLGDALPGNGLYKVYCKDSDIEAVFMACFSASRVEFF